MQVSHIFMTEDLQEITHHGSGSFPFAIYTTVAKNNIYGYVPLHWHEELQFVVVIKGCVKFTVDHDEFYIKEGEGIFINSGWLHSASSYNCEDGAYVCINFFPEFIESQNSRIFANYVHPVIKNQGIKAIKLIPDISWHNQILKLIPLLEETYHNQEPFYELTIKCEICKIWGLIIKHVDFKNELEVPIEPETNRRIKDMLEYIHHHYDSKITLDDLAEVSNLSRSECCRTFSKSVDSTPFEYIKRYRVARSMHLLKDKDKSITEIALEVGFNSSSYFISSFRKLTGFSPAQYQKTK